MRIGLKFSVLVFIGLGIISVLGGCASHQPEQPMAGQKVGSFMDDSYLTSAVKTKLLGDTGLKAFDVHVVTQNRVVTLSGTLPSEALRDEAIRVAKSVGGVVKVVSEIEVKPQP
jgi:hyperosmotically inducible protein